MSTFSKLIGMAQKAFGDDRAHSGSDARVQGSGSNSGSGSGDWRSIVRQAADRLTGDDQAVQQPSPQQQAPRPASRPAASAADPSGDPADRAAIARYDYLLQTADPHQIEQVHQEAFERLTPAQREQVEARMRSELPVHERPRSAGADDLARAAARTEASRPGFLRGLLARAGSRRTGPSATGGSSRAGLGMAAAGAGVGAVGGVLAAVAGGAVLSSVAAPLLEGAANLGVDFDALANGIDLEAIASGVDVGALTEGVDVEGLTSGVGDLAAGAGDTVSGLGDQVSGLGDRLGSFGLDDLFGR